MLRRVLFVAALLFLSLPARAQPTDATKAEARRRYDAGLAHFNLREYSQAIEDFQAAYRTLPDPVFLYNLAQSYRLSDNAEQALYFYQTYLRNAPDAPNHAEVEGRIGTLQKLIAEKRNTARPPDQTLAPKEPAVATPPSPTATTATPSPNAAILASNDRPEHTHIYRRWWFWTITGVVVVGAAVGFGVGFGLQKGASFNANVGTFGPSALSVRF